MTRSELLEQINIIFKHTLDNETLVIEETTNANDVDEWDSLSHVLIVVEIEKHFKVRFTSREIREWNSIQDVLNSLEEKGA